MAPGRSTVHPWPAGDSLSDEGERLLTASPLAPFLELRTRLVAERIGDGGLDVCEALTTELDTGIADLASDLPDGFAIMALGGYGRREQCLYSDVDVLVLHDGRDPGPAVRGVLYPLWDANLKVGHAVRTVKESSSSAVDDFEILTSLLSARLVAGDEALANGLDEALRGVVRGRPLAPKLASLERGRRARNPYQIMTADLKDGRGGLRTHQGLWWQRRREQLLGLAVESPTDREGDAHRSLMSARNALHAAARKANDTFIHELREPAAAWLGTDMWGIAEMVTTALDTGDHLADRHWPDIHVESDPMVKFGRRIFGAVKSRFASGEPEERPDTVLGIAVQAAGRTAGARFTLEEENSIRTSDATPWTEGDRRSFELLLSAGARGRAIFGQLDELGWMDREFPEWSAVASAPQLAPFHDHPVGTHLHRTVDEMLVLIDDRGDFGAVASELGSTEELVLAAFFHDIGKARGGNHADVGAELATQFLRRSGYGPATVSSVTHAVRHHLLLPETATRRDFADPAVVDEVIDVVGDARQLRILYLLAVADLRATGTSMWNSWRASLLRGLYRRALEAIEEEGATPATPDVDAVLAVAGGSHDRRTIAEHVASMARDYLDTTTASDVLWHLRAALELASEPVVHVDPDQPGRVLVVGSDRAGFLLAVSRAFTANGVGVLDARLRTRSDGVAIDTFHTADDRTGDPIDSDRWPSVQRDLTAAVTEGIDLRPTVDERVRTYQRPKHGRGPRVRTAVEGRYAVVEVRMEDDLGVFTSIVEALFTEGLDVHFARIDTQANEVRDVFFVRRVGGGPFRTDAELAALEKRLLDRFRA